MARQRDPRRDEAFKIFKENNGNITNRKIAEILAAPEKTISGWKSKDKWNQQLNGVLQSDERSTPKNKGSTANKGGAPIGNNNAKGNKGGAAPKGNNNAVTHGAYETIYISTLSQDEQNLLANMSDDPKDILKEEINAMRVRQLRMMQRIEKAESNLTENEKSILRQITMEKETFERDGRKVSVSVPSKKLKITEEREKVTPKIEWILKIEKELTKITGQLTKALKQLNEIDIAAKKASLLDAQIKKLNQEFNLPQDDKGELSIDEKVRLAKEYMDGLISDE